MTDLKSMIVGSFVLFAREGDASTDPVGTVSDVLKPVVGSPIAAPWVKLCTVEGFEPSPGQEKHEIWTPAEGSGRLVLKDVLENKQRFGGKIMGNDVGPLAIETLFRASQKLGASQKQFNPLSARSRKGWLHFELFDDTETLVFTLDLWCKIFTSMKFGSDPTKPEFEFETLYSLLNTGETV